MPDEQAKKQSLNLPTGSVTIGSDQRWLEVAVSVLMVGMIFSLACVAVIRKFGSNKTKEPGEMKERFSNGKTSKNVRTVGELIDELSRMPRDLRVVQGFSPSADVVVFNVSKDDRHLSLEDGGSWDLDADVESQDL